MNRPTIISILLACCLAACAQTPTVHPSITVTSSPGKLLVDGQHFTTNIAACAAVSLIGMPQDSPRTMGMGSCSGGVFHLEFDYSLVGQNCVPTPQQQVSATVLALDTQTLSGDSKPVTIPWGTLCALTSPVGVQQISYEFVLPPPNSGHLGPTSFTNATITFLFDSNTSNVFQFDNPVSGYVNLGGNATVMVQDSNGAVLGKGTFLPKAGIFIAVDNENHGVGFGSLSLPPWDPNFPGQITYPLGVHVGSPWTYDLKSFLPLAGVTGKVYSCTNGPAAPTCGNAVGLPTTAGDFVLNPMSGATSGTATFKAVP